VSEVVRLRDAKDVKKFGGKAANLGAMLRASLPVPNGFAISINAFDEHGKLKASVTAEIAELLDKNKLYAVRSSALAEDAEGASWAGQFETFLNTKPTNVISKVEACHNSTKTRAKVYADATGHAGFNIAVVVQEMLKPKYAGVLFTKDPIGGTEKFVTEYVEGLGESLVSGQKDPKRIIWAPGEKVRAPFDIVELTKSAQKIEQVFNEPQDIEWAWADNKMWLVQARPITTTQVEGKGYFVGEPDELFYWGPSRAKPIYMSDFMTAAEQFFMRMSKDPSMPKPPKSLVLFCEGKMVWLSNTQAFTDFVEATFKAYEKRNKFDEDFASWQQSVKSLDETQGDAKELVQAWDHTLFAEFALYGAESELAKRLERFDAKTRQEIWGTFTLPIKPTFLTKIDQELLVSNNPATIAQKYPWIENGYEGISDNAKNYFVKRLALLSENTKELKVSKKNKPKPNTPSGLTAKEVNALDLARKIAEMLDDRKAWMMRTRSYIKSSANKIEHGWMYENGKVTLIDEKDANELWKRYVDFKVSASAVAGIVASNGGLHFINGEVAVIASPTDSVADDRILVVPSTSPSYVPLMRKARGLVTDHGGMMSHAAIVAREFGLPCIVGTKQATKVLKTGDKVVLDLVKGEVNK
jgi:phosphohistidine swiveling domain-containing protein